MKESLGSALRGFCMLSKGYNRSFIDKGWALRVAFRQLALPKNDVFPWWITGLAYIYQCLKHALFRAGDIFRRGRGHPEPICTCSKLLTIRQLALPKSGAFSVMTWRTRFIYRCLKHALLRAGDIFSCGRGHPEPICTRSKLLTIRQLALPKSDAFVVMIFL